MQTSIVYRETQVELTTRDYTFWKTMNYNAKLFHYDYNNLNSIWSYPTVPYRVSALAGGKLEVHNWYELTVSKLVDFKADV